MTRITNSAGAWCGDGSGYSRPVRPADSDKSRPPERIIQSPADFWLAEHERVKKLLADADAAKERERQQIREANRQRELKAQQEAQRQQAQAIFAANQRMLEQTITMHGLTTDESQAVWDRMLESGRFDLEICEVLCREMKGR